MAGESPVVIIMLAGGGKSFIIYATSSVFTVECYDLATEPINFEPY